MTNKTRIMEGYVFELYKAQGRSVNYFQFFNKTNNNIFKSNQIKVKKNSDKNDKHYVENDLKNKKLISF